MFEQVVKVESSVDVGEDTLGCMCLYTQLATHCNGVTPFEKSINKVFVLLLQSNSVFQLQIVKQKLFVYEVLLSTVFTE